MTRDNESSSDRPTVLPVCTNPGLWIQSFVIIFFLTWSPLAYSQAGNQGLIVRDNSLGDLQGQVVPPGADAFGAADYFIRTAYGERLGSTLFQSFSQFGIGAGEVAAFEFDLDIIETFIVRVTGGDLSRVDGVIRVPALGGQHTSLFLMNPSGFIFGPDASLNLGASTAFVGAASSLEFVDGTRWLADENAPTPLIEVAPLRDFGFLPSASGDITIDGATLEPAFGLHLTGENVTVENDAILSFRPLVADEASLSIRATGEIVVDGLRTNVGRGPPSGNPIPQFLESIVFEASRIRVSGAAKVDVTGFNVAEDRSTLPGRIEFTATESIRVVGMPAGQQGTTGILALALDQNTAPAAEVGTIRLTAPTIEISGEAVVSSTTGSPGTGGGIEISADEFRLTDRARIQSNSLQSNFETGAGGNILVNADRVLISDGASISSSSETGASAGRIDVIGDRIHLHSAGLSTSAVGAEGGDIRLVATGDMELSESVVSASVDGGDGGNVDLGAGRSLVLRDGTIVLARAASIGGRGGEINLSAQAIAIEAGVTLDASAPGGPDAQGVVNIVAPALAADPTTTSLETPLFDSVGLARSLCDLDVEASSFVANELTAHAPDSLDIQVGGNSNGKAIDDHPYETWIRSKQDAHRARSALHASDFDRMATHGIAALVATEDLDDGLRVRLSLHLARTWLQAVEKFSSHRAEALQTVWSLLDEALQIARRTSDSRASAYIWGAFAELYQADGRSSDARSLISRALALAEGVAPDPSRYRLHWTSARLAWRAGEIEVATRAYERALELEEALAPIRPGATRSEDRVNFSFGLTNIQAIRHELIDLLLAQSEFAPTGQKPEIYRRVRHLISSIRLDEIQEYFRDPCLGRDREGRTPEHRSDPDAAVIHLLPLPDRIEIFVSRGSQIDRFATPIGLAELETMAAAFEVALQKPFTRQFRRPAERLYEWLIAPIEETLRSEGIDTLVFSAAGVLTGIPFSALMSGDGFLVERYSIASSAGLGLLAQRTPDAERPDVLIAGLSKGAADLNPLPGVLKEIDAIRLEFSGETLLDEDFQIGNLGAALERDAPPILHIASHGVLGESARESYVDTWDGRLDLDALGRLIRRRTRGGQSLDLLVLSACETLGGDQHAAIGLAGVAVKAGARSVLGALWAISDDATRSLMASFYASLAESGLSKADSLARAQRALLAVDEFAHPYFWSGFVLANDWR